MYSKFTADALLSTEPSLSSAGKSAMHMFFHQEDEKKNCLPICKTRKLWKEF